MMIRLGYTLSVGLFIFLRHQSVPPECIGLGIAIGGGTWLVLALVSRKARAVYGHACSIIATLNISFVLCWTLSNIVVYAAVEQHHSGIISLVQALIICAALAWDIMSSGAAITNKHTETFPRLARVAMFTAYIASVALFVMVSASSHLTDPINGDSFIFESEGLVGVGLQLFGGPLIFLMAVLRLRNLLSAADRTFLTMRTDELYAREAAERTSAPTLE
jgi:hypothetical protein